MRPEPKPCLLCGEPVEPEFSDATSLWRERDIHSADLDATDCQGELWAQKERSRERQALLDLVSSRLPSRLSPYSFDLETDGGTQLIERFGGAHTRLVDRAARWKMHESVFLRGGVGAGKSVLAAAMVRRAALHKRLRTLYWAHEPSLLHHTKAAIAARTPAPLGDAMRADLVTFDDLGLGAASDFDHDAIGSLIAYRYDALLPVIVTSTLTIDEVGQKYGEFVASRLWQMTGGKVAEVPGPDRRIER